jgi:hypothetical protein
MAKNVLGAINGNDGIVSKIGFSNNDNLAVNITKYGNIEELNDINICNSPARIF